MIKSFITVTSKENQIKLSMDYCLEAKGAVLWNHKGLYGLIPFAKIQNFYELAKTKENSADFRPHTIQCIFFWRDVVPVPQNIAKLLLGEDENDQCTYRTKSSSKGS